MQIRTRLTLQFILLGGLIMIISAIAIYFSSAELRKEDFYNRIRNKARITASQLLDAVEHGAGTAPLIPGWNYPRDLHNERIIILNYLNDTIYTTDKFGDIPVENEILERIRLYERVRYRLGDFEVLGTLYSTPLYRYVVIAAATDIEGMQHLRKLRTTLIEMCIISLLLFAVAGWVFSGRALRPISHVVKKVEDISITSMHLRVPEGNGTDEIGRLARTFNSMLDRLETAFVTQKDFIANASHELRTPLTSINGQLEVLLLKDRSAEDYKNALQSVLDDLGSLIDLANKLLLMARTGSETGLAYNDKIRIDELLWQIRDEMKRNRENSHVNISIDDSLSDADQMIVTGDEYLLKTAFVNIIDNACKYSTNNSVDVLIKNSDGNLKVFFSDKGIGISGEELDKVFEPFYRASNSITFQGTGIGLTLVKQIIKNHKGRIEMESEKDRGTTVKVELPVG